MNNNLALSILLVEDSPSDAGLALEGFEANRIVNHVKVIKDGEELLGYLRREAPFENRPEVGLILLDLKLPKKDGREVLRELKQDSKLCMLPVFIMGHSGLDLDLSEEPLNHARGLIQKPVDLDQLILAMQSLGDFWLEIVRFRKDQDL